MKNSYLVHRKTGSSYLVRSVVPLDLQPLFESRQFHLSLGCGILSQSRLLSFYLNRVTQSLYNLIRENPYEHCRPSIVPRSVMSLNKHHAIM